MSDNPVSAGALKALHEKKIKEINEPSGKKEIVWNPTENGTTGAHTKEGFHLQTKKKLAKGPPPKKSLSELP
jgi:hypothetical protein